MDHFEKCTKRGVESTKIINGTGKQPYSDGSFSAIYDFSRLLHASHILPMLQNPVSRITSLISFMSSRKEYIIYW